jgi:kynurenine formamidase
MARKIIDLTHSLYNGLEGYPGNYRVDLETLHEVEKTGYHVSKVTFDTHLGTHIDTPMHINVGAQGVDQADLEKLIGPAKLFDVSGKGAGSEIAMGDLGPRGEAIGKGDRVVLRTGWQKHFGTPEFFQNFPGISLDLASQLVDRGVVLIGIEPPSVHPTLHLEVHHKLIDNGVQVVEALANLDRIQSREFEIICLPLRIKECDGSPCRVVAVEEIA